MDEIDPNTPRVTVSVGNSVIDISSALQEVLKKSMIADGLVHGIHQACKALDRREAVLCILASDNTAELYQKLVVALCTEHSIPLIKVDSNKKLGEWSGLCKIDRNGKPRRICKCSCVVIKDYGEDSLSLDVIKQFLQIQANQ